MVDPETFINRESNESHHLLETENEIRWSVSNNQEHVIQFDSNFHAANHSLHDEEHYHSTHEHSFHIDEDDLSLII